MAIIAWPNIRAKFISDYGFTGGRRLPIKLQSGGVHPVRVSTKARYWVTLHYHGLRTTTLAPAPYGDRSEAAAIRDCLMALDRGDSVQMADPVDGAVRIWVLDEEEEIKSFRRVFEKDRAPFVADVRLRSV